MSFAAKDMLLLSNIPFFKRFAMWITFNLLLSTILKIFVNYNETYLINTSRLLSQIIIILVNNILFTYYEQFTFINYNIYCNLFKLQLISVIVTTVLLYNTRVLNKNIWDEYSISYILSFILYVYHSNCSIQLPTISNSNKQVSELWHPIKQLITNSFKESIQIIITSFLRYFILFYISINGWEILNVYNTHNIHDINNINSIQSVIILLSTLTTISHDKTNIILYLTQVMWYTLSYIFLLITLQKSLIFVLFYPIDTSLLPPATITNTTTTTTASTTEIHGRATTTATRSIPSYDHIPNAIKILLYTTFALDIRVNHQLLQFTTPLALTSELQSGTATSNLVARNLGVGTDTGTAHTRHSKWREIIEYYNTYIAPSVVNAVLPCTVGFPLIYLTLPLTSIHHMLLSMYTLLTIHDMSRTTAITTSNTTSSVYSVLYTNERVWLPVVMVMCQTLDIITTQVSYVPYIR